MDPGSPLQSPIRSRSRSGSRSRRHRSPRSPLGPDGDVAGRERWSYYETRHGIPASYNRPAAYRDRDSRYSSDHRDRESRYSSDHRVMDPYARAPPVHSARPPNASSGPSGGRRSRSRSRSPMSSRRRHEGDRENPPTGRCIGIFGLSIYTREQEILQVFTPYGPIEDVQIVYDAQSGRSRGFAFVYFMNIADATEAKERCNGIEIDGRKIRVDFSVTQRAHTPTPGVYMGKPHPRSQQGSSSRGSGYGYDRGYNPYPSHRSVGRMHPYPPRGGGRHYYE